MKKTLISLTVGLLLSGTAMAESNAVAEVVAAKNEALQEISQAKEKAINEINNPSKEIAEAMPIVIPATIAAPMAEGLSAKDFELKLAASKKFENYGGIEVVRSISNLGLGEMYEIKLGGKDNGVISGDTNFIFLGDVIKFDNGTHANLSADYRSSLMESAAREEVAKISEETFITYPATTEQIGTLYVYTDTTCGYCRKLHNEIDQLTSGGVEVKYIPYPRSGSDEKVPVSRDEKGELVYGENKTLIEMGSIYCQEDKEAALTNVKSGGSIEGYKEAYEANKASCNAVIKEGYDSGRKIGFGGTPFLYLDNGTAVPGYQSATNIINMFKAKK
jgi:thiol:disulfide interchange protein DsbC